MVLIVDWLRSGTPELTMASRMRSTVCAFTSVGALKSAPPLNSMPNTRPRHSRAMMAMEIITADTMYQRRRRPMKS